MRLGRYKNSYQMNNVPIEVLNEEENSACRDRNVFMLCIGRELRPSLSCSKDA